MKKIAFYICLTLLVLVLHGCQREQGLSLLLKESFANTRYNTNGLTINRDERQFHLYDGVNFCYVIDDDIYWFSGDSWIKEDDGTKEQREITFLMNLDGLTFNDFEHITDTEYKMKTAKSNLLCLILDLPIDKQDYSIVFTANTKEIVKIAVMQGKNIVTEIELSDHGQVRIPGLINDDPYLVEYVTDTSISYSSLENFVASFRVKVGVRDEYEAIVKRSGRKISVDIDEESTYYEFSSDYSTLKHYRWEKEQWISVEYSVTPLLRFLLAPNKLTENIFAFADYSSFKASHLDLIDLYATEHHFNSNGATSSVSIANGLLQSYSIINQYKATSLIVEFESYEQQDIDLPASRLVPTFEATDFNSLEATALLVIEFPSAQQGEISMGVTTFTDEGIVYTVGGREIKGIWQDNRWVLNEQLTDISFEAIYGYIFSSEHFSFVENRYVLIPEAIDAINEEINFIYSEIKGELFYFGRELKAAEYSFANSYLEYRIMVTYNSSDARYSRIL